ncbi:MAG TPA: T9SS type A sorting domain-containing protein, partial [Caldithrix sp.]|nr:T9SS type A sorting domain-containing protein [Caldithrix sp.]
WEVKLSFPANSTIYYKFFANAAGDPNGNGWESNLNTGSTNRELTIGVNDTILPLQYFNKVTGNDPLFTPYTPTDSMDIWFRVNMQAYQPFDPTTQTLMVKGGTWPGSWGDLTWNGDSTLAAMSPETPSDNAGQFTYPVENFYSTRVRIPKDSITVGQNIEYKFVIVDKNTLTPVIEWENLPGGGNRSFVVSADKPDTTLYWRWWNDAPYIGATGADTVMVKFRADMTRAINENGFSIGDTLIVRWGYNGTALFEEDTLVNEPLTNFYSVTDSAKKVHLGEDLQYQYYLVKGGNEYREVFFDFNDPSTSSQEKRKVMIPDPAPALVEAQDIENSNTALHRMPRFQNTSPISQDVLVTYTCDLRPPYWQVKLAGDTIQNIQSNPPFGWVYPGQEDSIFVWGVYINGPGNGTSGWQGWDLINLAPYKMFDDGTHGDMTAGDSIYAFQVLFSPDSSDIVGQEFKFGINAGDNEGGSTGFGLNHIENIDDSQGQFTIASDFGSINPGFYWRWDFNNHVVGIDNPQDVTVITRPRLSANYPNPFNPVTTINFVLPSVMKVDLVIYNVLGQKVRTLLSGKQQAGAHKVLWNGTDDHGQIVGSGIYFYRLKTKNYDKTMRMVLMK